MAQVRPFAAIRPRKGLEERIAALPYDVYSSEEARKETQREPYSFLKIDRAETQFPPGTDPYDEKVYRRAEETLWDMVRRGDFIREERPCYYLYELGFRGRTQTGIAALASIDDYLSGRIKKHENTREDKELDRIRHVDVCGAQTGPIFLAYRDRKGLDEITDRVKEERALYDFTSRDGVTHRLWRVEDREQELLIRREFAETDSLYIADGHHRCASAVKAGLRRRSLAGRGGAETEADYFLAVLFPDSQLTIMAYNRVVKDLNGYTPEEFLEKLSEKFELTRMGARAYRPEAKGCFGLYLDRSWYKLMLKKAFRKEGPVEGLDVSALQREALEPILFIRDPKTDKRIDFVGGIRGLTELERRCAADCAAAFSMYPTSIEELFAAADAGALMPPKSTWFEPKLRSGLLIHDIREKEGKQI